jgi:hypothetical protein
MAKGFRGEGVVAKRDCPGVTQHSRDGLQPTLIEGTVGSRATLASREPVHSFDVDRDLLRIDRRVVGDVPVVTHQQLQGVLAGR